MIKACRSIFCFLSIFLLLGLSSHGQERKGTISGHATDARSYRFSEALADDSKGARRGFDLGAYRQDLFSSEAGIGSHARRVHSQASAGRRKEFSRSRRLPHIRWSLRPLGPGVSVEPPGELDG